MTYIMAGVLLMFTVIGFVAGWILRWQWYIWTVSRIE